MDADDATSEGNAIEEPAVGASEVGHAASRIERASLPSRAYEALGPRSSEYVYALGQVQMRFPSISIEKEFNQVLGRMDFSGRTDREALHEALADRANRYLARELCWVFMIEGIETYLLVPRDPGDIELLVEAARPRPEQTDLDLVIGRLGPLSGPESCGLIVPIVLFTALYSFSRDALLSAIPPTDDSSSEDDQFQASAAELLDRILQLADNAGNTDSHRALNYLAVRYPAIYYRAATAYRANESLTGVDVRPSRLSGVRAIVDVIFAFRHRETDVTEKYFVRVDVTDEFPFVVTKLSPYFDR
jgi:hypothetical protein